MHFLLYPPSSSSLVMSRQQAQKNIVEASASRLLQATEEPTRSQMLALWDEVPVNLKQRKAEGVFLGMMGIGTRSATQELRMSTELPEFTRCMCRFAAHRAPNLFFASLVVREGPPAPPHRDQANSFLPSFAVSLTEPKRGQDGVWVEFDKGRSAREFEGRTVWGQEHDGMTKLIMFDARTLLHAGGRPSGQRRVMLLGFVPQLCLHVPRELATSLRSRGFACPEPNQVLSAAQDHASQQLQRPVTQSRLLFRRTSRPTWRLNDSNVMIDVDTLSSTEDTLTEDASQGAALESPPKKLRVFTSRRPRHLATIQPARTVVELEAVADTQIDDGSGQSD